MATSEKCLLQDDFSKSWNWPLAKTKKILLSVTFKPGRFSKTRTHGHVKFGSFCLSLEQWQERPPFLGRQWKESGGRHLSSFPDAQWKGILVGHDQKQETTQVITNQGLPRRLLPMQRKEEVPKCPTIWSLLVTRGRGARRTIFFFSWCWGRFSGSETLKGVCL